MEDSFYDLKCFFTGTFSRFIYEPATPQRRTFKKAQHKALLFKNTREDFYRFALMLIISLFNTKLEK